ncbi:MAG: DMT family transporter [Deltaproteobacteria bacterium]|nr:DMT family transporter [Deltaproteobacteria bacterium]
MRETDRNERLIGAFWVLLSAAGFGTGPIFARIAYADGVDTPTLMFLRFSIAGAVMALLLWRLGDPWPRQGDLPVLLLMGTCGYVGQSLCYFSALHYASAGLTALLLYLYPAIVCVIVAVTTRRALERPRLWALVAALIGTALTVSDSLQGSLLGIALGIGAALIYSIYIVVGEHLLKTVSAMGMAAVASLTAAAVYGGAIVWRGPAWPASGAGWGAAAAIAFFSTILGVLGLFAGLKRLGAVDASTLSAVEPILTIVLAAAFLKEFIRPRQFLGGLLILAAVIFLIRYGTPRYKDVPAP